MRLKVVMSDVGNFLSHNLAVPDHRIGKSSELDSAGETVVGSTNSKVYGKRLRITEFPTTEFVQALQVLVIFWGEPRL